MDSQLRIAERKHLSDIEDSREYWLLMDRIHNAAPSWKIGITLYKKSFTGNSQGNRLYTYRSSSEIRHHWEHSRSSSLTQYNNTNRSFTIVNSTISKQLRARICSFSKSKQSVYCSTLDFNTKKSVIMKSYYVREYANYVKEYGQL